MRYALPEARWPGSLHRRSADARFFFSKTEIIFLPNNLLFGTLPSELAKLSLLSESLWN